MGYTEEDFNNTKILQPGEEDDGTYGMVIKPMDWDNPEEVRRYRDLLARYGKNYEDFLPERVRKNKELLAKYRVEDKDSSTTSTLDGLPNDNGKDSK